MLSSISGQSDRWAQLAAYRSPSAAQSGQDAGVPSSGSSGNTTSANAGAVAGGTVSAITSGTSAALLALAGVGATPSNPNQVGGTPSDQAQRSFQLAANAAPPDYTETGSVAQASGGTTGGVPVSIGTNTSLLTLVGQGQSSASVAAATPGVTNITPAAVPAVGGPAPIAGDAGNSPSTGAADNGGGPSTGLQQPATNPDVLASITGSGPAGASGTLSAPPPPSSGPPPGNGDIDNNGTTVASNSGTTSASDNTGHGYLTQFAASAYASNTVPGLSSSQVSAFGGISA